MIENFMTLKKIMFHDRELLVSDTGRVFYGDSGEEIPQQSNHNGYKFIHVWSKTEKKYFNPLVHRLVAESFLTNKLKKPCVNHKNLNRSDNRLENLEWVTHKENSSYEPTRKKYSEAKKGEKHPMFGRTGEKSQCSKKVQQFSKEGVLLNTFPCAKEAERKTGIFQSSISRCCNKKRLTAGEYIWKFA